MDRQRLREGRTAVAAAVGSRVAWEFLLAVAIFGGALSGGSGI